MIDRRRNHMTWPRGVREQQQAQTVWSARYGERDPPFRRKRVERRAKACKLAPA